MLQYALEVSHYVAVRDAHKAKGLAFEPLGPTLVICFLQRMGIAVDFNDQPGLSAVKIGDIVSKPHLASKLCA